jgi:hypothetical protein
MKRSVPTTDVRLFHVTLAANLEAIATHGLRGGRGSSFSGYGWETPRVFFSERGAVRCWWNKIHDLVEHHNDGEDILPRLQVPVVLRAEQRDLPVLTDDPLGSRDCLGGRSFYAKRFVLAPAGVEVWDGRRWQDVRNVDPETVMRAYVKSEKHIQEDDSEWTEVDLQLPGRWPW